MKFNPTNIFASFLVFINFSSLLLLLPFIIKILTIIHMNTSKVTHPNQINNYDEFY